MDRQRRFALTACVVLLLSVALPSPLRADQPLTAGPPGILAAYRQRLAHVRGQLPQVTAAAEAVARRWVERKQVLIHPPSAGGSAGFASELAFRAGGLDNLLFHGQPALHSSNDVVIYGPRSWADAAAELQAELPKHRQAGWMIVVFGSKAGAPEGLPIDFLIDNGATGPSEEEAALNHVVNLTNGWLWCCELTAALTRLGQRPGVLQGMTLPGSTAHNQQYQYKPAALYPADTPIAAGVLAEQYLRELDKLLADLESVPRQEQIGRAADLSAQTVRGGHTVWAASFTHALSTEAPLNLVSPMKAFLMGGAETITANVKAGDLFFWFGEWTLNAPYHDYLQTIGQTGAAYVPSYRPIREPMEPMEGDTIFYDQRIDDAAMVLEQSWPYENAVVEVPFPPGKMAPVSGVYACLLYRALDEAIAARAGGGEPVAAPAGATH